MLVFDTNVDATVAVHRGAGTPIFAEYLRALTADDVRPVTWPGADSAVLSAVLGNRGLLISLPRGDNVRTNNVICYSGGQQNQIQGHHNLSQTDVTVLSTTGFTAGDYCKLYGRDSTNSNDVYEIVRIVSVDSATEMTVARGQRGTDGQDQGSANFIAVDDKKTFFFQQRAGSTQDDFAEFRITLLPYGSTVGQPSAHGSDATITGTLDSLVHYDGD